MTFTEWLESEDGQRVVDYLSSSPVTPYEAVNAMQDTWNAALRHSENSDA